MTEQTDQSPLEPADDQEFQLNLDQIVDGSIEDQPYHNIKREPPTEGEHLQEKPKRGRPPLNQNREGEKNLRKPDPKNGFSSGMEEDRFRRIYRTTFNNRNIPGPNGVIIRKRKMGFTDDELYLLQMDLKAKRYSKKELMKKYSISESTINRYVRKFNELKLEQQRFPPYPEELAKNIKNKHNMLKETTPEMTNSCEKEVLKEGGETESQNSYPPGYEPFQSRKKNSKCRLIEAKLLDIFKQYPQIYQNEAANMLSKYFKQDISVHVVSRCMRNISARQKELQNQQHVSTNGQIKGFFGNLQENSFQNIEYRYAFAKQYMNLKEKKVVYTYLDIFTKIEPGKEERIHFALAMSGEGKIVHWKLKPYNFTPEQIANFIQQTIKELQGHTILLDDIRINRQVPIIQLLKNKSISYLYLPPFSPHLNPIKRVFVYIAQEFRTRLRENMQLKETLKLAHSIIVQAKNKIYLKQVQFSRHYIDAAYKREPFPFDRLPQY